LTAQILKVKYISINRIKREGFHLSGLSMNNEKLREIEGKIRFFEIGLVSPISRPSNIISFEFMNDPGLFI